MPDFEKKIILKQHTPLIHFQADQDDAALRATELKPKLDRFLIKYLFKNDFDSYKRYLIGRDDNKSKNDFAGKESFDYKLRISAAQKQVVYINRRNTDNYEKDIVKCINNVPYFGDLKAVYNEYIHVNIFSFHEDFLSQISEELLIYFFTITNFGSRQNKGFGSFMLDGVIKDRIGKCLEKYHNSGYWNAVCGFSKVVPGELCLQKIHRDYQLLKSGSNKPYDKSKLFIYMRNKNIGWEKKRIKQEMKKNNILFRQEHPFTGNDNQNEEFKYIRVLLGLSEHYDFLKPVSNGRISINIIHKDKKIDRFRSPLHFKVFDNVIYLFYDQIDKRIFDQEFIFSINPDDKHFKPVNFQLPSPAEREFDILDFLKESLDNSWKYIEVKNG